MSASAEYTEYVLELLEPLGRVRTTRFFGGVGLTLGNAQFAMVMGNSLYFVVDDNTRPKYEKAGMAPFSYLTKKGRVQVRRYFELPEEILTDTQALKLWAAESIKLAARDKKPKSNRPQPGVIKKKRRILK